VSFVTHVSSYRPIKLDDKLNYFRSNS